jgi:hypothetical protein
VKIVLLPDLFFFLLHLDAEDTAVEMEKPGITVDRIAQFIGLAKFHDPRSLFGRAQGSSISSIDPP